MLTDGNAWSSFPALGAGRIVGAARNEADGPVSRIHNRHKQACLCPDFMPTMRLALLHTARSARQTPPECGKRNIILRRFWNLVPGPDCGERRMHWSGLLIGLLLVSGSRAHAQERVSPRML